MIVWKFSFNHVSVNVFLQSACTYTFAVYSKFQTICNSSCSETKKIYYCITFICSDTVGHCYHRSGKITKLFILYIVIWRPMIIDKKCSSGATG